MLSRTFTVCFSRLLLASVAALSLSANAQNFPNKPVKLVVPYPAGGFPDTVARVLSKALTEKWNQQVIIDNRPGGSGAVAAQTIKAAGPADGYTLLVTDGSMFTINPALFAKLEYDAKKDFVPVTALAKAPLFLAAHPSVPAHTLAVLKEGSAPRLRAPLGARVVLVGGVPLGPRFIVWNFVSSRRDLIAAAQRDWEERRFDTVPGETEFIPLPKRPN